MVGVWTEPVMAQLMMVLVMAGASRGVEWRAARAVRPGISASSKMATARVQPAEALRILCGKQLM